MTKKKGTGSVFSFFFSPFFLTCEFYCNFFEERKKERKENWTKKRQSDKKMEEEDIIAMRVGDGGRGKRVRDRSGICSNKDR